MDRTKLGTRILFAVVMLLMLASSARADVGIFRRNNCQSGPDAVTAPVNDQTWCFDSATDSLLLYTGNAWVKQTGASALGSLAGDTTGPAGANITHQWHRTTVLVTTAMSPYTQLSTDSYIDCLPNTGAVTINLLVTSDVGNPTGNVLTVKNQLPASAACNIVPHAGDTIDGASGTYAVTSPQPLNLHNANIAGTGSWERWSGILPGTTCVNQFASAIDTTGTLTCSSVNLSNSVTGTLPNANGGSGTVYGAPAYFSQISNAGGAIGTTANKLAKVTGNPSTALISTAGDTSGALGIVTAGAGIGGTATIQMSGLTNCVFDNSTLAGDYVAISPSVAGDCHDAGASFPTSGQVLGRVLSTNGSAGTYQMFLFAAEQQGSSASSSGTVTSVGVSVASVPEIAVSGGPITGSGTFTFTKNAESANTVAAGPASGGAAAWAFRLLVGADLPNPSSTSLGGIQSIVAQTHKWINSVSTLGVPNLVQPACADLSDSGTGCSGAAGVPIASGAGDFGAGTTQTGGVLTGAVAKVNGNTPGVAAVAHKFVTTIDSSARGTLAQPDFTDLTGTATDAQLANGYSGIGACAAHKFATTLNRNAIQSCAQPAASDVTGLGVLATANTVGSAIVKGDGSGGVASAVAGTDYLTPNPANVGAGTDSPGGYNGLRTNEKNILDFGAIASNARLSCSTTNGSNAPICSGASSSDFAGTASGGLANSNEYGVLYGAGAAAAVAQPTGFTGQPVTSTDTMSAANYNTRLLQGCTVQNALAWCAAGSTICQVTNSDLYEKGNSVTIPGAGVSGGNLSTTIASVSDYLNQITLGTAASTTVHGAAMTGANCTTTRRFQAYPIDAVGGWGTPTSILTVTNTPSALNWGNWVDVQLQVPQPTMVSGTYPSWTIGTVNQLPVFAATAVPWWPLPINIPMAWAFYCGEGSSGALTLCGVENPTFSYRWSDQATGVSTSRSGTVVTATAGSSVVFPDFMAGAPINVTTDSNTAHNGTGLTVLAVGPCTSCPDSGATLTANQIRYTAASSGTDSGTGATVAIPAPWNDELLGGQAKGWPTIVTFREVGRWYGEDTILGNSAPSTPPNENVYFKFASISSNTVNITPQFGTAVSQTGTSTMGRDNGPNVNASIAAVTDAQFRSGTVYVPRALDLYPIASPIYARKTFGLHLLGAGTPSIDEQTASSSGFLYVGALGGSALILNGAYAPSVEQIGFHSYDGLDSLNGSTMGQAIDGDGYDPGDGGGFMTFTRPYFEEVYVGTANTAVRWCNINATNGEFGRFNDSTIWSYGVTASPGGTVYLTGNFMGIRINSGNALGTRFESSAVTGMIGIWSNIGGFWSAQTAIGNVSGIGLLLGGSQTHSVTWGTSNNESLARAVDAWQMGQNNGGSPIALLGDGFSNMKAFADSRFITATGPTQLRLEGNNFSPADGEGYGDYATQEFPSGFIFPGGSTSGFGGIHSDGNYYFNICNPFGQITSTTQLHPKTDADVCLSSIGNAQPVDYPNNICTSWQYTTAGSPICVAKINNGNDMQIGLSSPGRIVTYGSSLYNASALLDGGGVLNSALGTCSGGIVTRQTVVTDNDGACTPGNTPSHSSCTIGTNCHTCTVLCGEQGGSSYGWSIVGGK